jgi:cation diffusion facilitator CzcD-associated flavoprotein CzcO
VALGGAAGRTPRIVVIGAGIAGILMGIKLLERGVRTFTILEKANSLGGTWRDNTYPGVACDVAAHLYVYSFEPNPAWRRRFAKGREILGYYARTAKKYGVTPFVRFGQEVTSAEWRGSAWTVRTAAGLELEADIIVTATGRLHHPVYPDIAGLADFKGQAFHSARWPEGLALEGKRVGVVGTGSTATQITVALAAEVSRFLLFQRTPQWILPVADEPIPLWKRLWFRINRAAARAYYRELEAQTEARGAAATGDRAARAARDQICYDALAGVKDPDLRARLTPDYEVGCKRMVISERFYDAVQQPNVELVTEPIDHVAPEGVVTRDGRLHALDVLVLATGFDSRAYCRPMQVRGLDGTVLDEMWADVAWNYRSVSAPAMPNFFMINGPYSPGGSASVVSIIETHVGYVLQCIDRIAERKVALAPKQARAVAFLEDVRRRSKESVWGTGGCDSWYLDRHGVPTLDPIPLSVLASQMARVKFDDFEERPLASPAWA